MISFQTTLVFLAIINSHFGTYNGILSFLLKEMKWGQVYDWLSLSWLLRLIYVKTIDAWQGTFISWTKDRFFKKKKDRQVPASKKLAPDLDAIIAEVCRHYKVKPTHLKTVHRGIENEPRDVAMYLIRSICAEPLMRIGANFGLTQYSSVSSAVMRVKAKLQKDRKFKGRIQDIESDILKGQT